MRGAKIDKISLGEDWGPFSAPCGRSRQSKTGILQETAVRSLWNYSLVLRPSNLDQKTIQIMDFAGLRGEND